MNQIKAGAVLNYVIIGLNTLTGLLYTPYMLKCLGQNEYGLYSLVASLIAYLTLLDFGFGSAIVRYTAKIRATRSKDEEWSLYGMFICGYSILGFIVALVGIILYFNIDRMFDGTMTEEDLSQARIMMAMMIVNLVVTFPFSVYGSIISAYEKFVFQRVFNIIRILLTTVVLVTVLYLGYKAIALVAVQTVFNLGSLLANVLYCKYKLHIKIRITNINWILFRDIAIFSWWNFVGAITDRIYWSTGQFVLGAVSGTIAVAVFSVAISLMSMYMSMSTSINSVLLPRVTRMALNKENDAEISNLFIRTGRLQFCIMSLILSGLIVFGQQFITLWAGSDYSESYLITILFCTVLTCPLIQNVGLTIIVARGQVKFRSLSYLIISLTSLWAQYYFAKRFGVLGCAWTVTIALFIGQWIVMNIYYKVKQKINILSFWRNIAKMSIFPFIFTTVCFYMTRSIALESWLCLISSILIFSVLYIPLFWKFGMNEYEHMQFASILKIFKR